MLRNCLNDKYLSLEEDGYFLWNLIDGKKTVTEMNFDYIAEFGRIGITIIGKFLELLKEKGFLEDKPVPIYNILSDRLKQNKASSRILKGISYMTRSNIAAGWTDGYFQWLYKKIGGIIFSRFSLSLILLLAVADLALAFYFIIVKNESLLLLSRPGSHDVILMMIISYLSIFVHENAHGLTVKHYGRKVIRGGILFMYGSPLPYVDTTDIWMKNAGPRIKVSFAGPCSNGVIGAISLILAWIMPESVYQNLFVHTGIVNSLIYILNLMPIVESDGHYILQDWLERPRFREESLAFVGKEMWLKLARLERWGKWDFAHLLYGVVGILSLIYMIAAAFHLWEYTFQSIALEIAAHPRMVFEILSISINIAFLSMFWKTWRMRKKSNIAAAIELNLGQQSGRSAS
jgi:putative peptide zinc metalloprotease protein